MSDGFTAEKRLKLKKKTKKGSERDERTFVGYVRLRLMPKGVLY